MADDPEETPPAQPPAPPAPLERIEACRREVAEVLRRHNCDIVAYLATPEPVGERTANADHYQGMLVRASVAIVPR
jgi:hypothetical protein